MRLCCFFFLPTLILFAGCSTLKHRASNPYEDSVESHRSSYKKVQLPFLPGTEFLISQGAFGEASHNEPGNQYSWDFDVPLGTAVVAVEGGRVLEVWAPGNQGGCDSKFSNDAHNIKIEHSDQTVAQYVHVDPRVKVGSKVRAGQIIGVTALNGWICTPQLHYGIYASRNELYASPHRKTIPILFIGISEGIARTGQRATVTQTSQSK